ncbi:molecular chaperone HtpG [Nitratidesulfovibrio sp. 1201_IL3209]|uniref:molecular chaperone HtpG n=1 Tax=Nitratidesulfovibrio sp. 1201_IL3209 TaxID=3084053 RepID=UPI002FD9A0B2
MTAAAHETHEFRTEVQKLLHIITHSLYTNREIFLRELVSNASDALDKLRFFQSRGDTVAAPDLPLDIAISVDKDARILRIADTGVGMTRQELIDNLGTIARSGSERFMAEHGIEQGLNGTPRSDAANADGDADGEAASASAASAASPASPASSAPTDAASIIGRFGVGFYSVFMVADKVRVTSRSCQPGAAAHVWESDGSGSFSVSGVDGGSGADGGNGAGAPARGTVIEAHIKEDASEFLERHRLESIVRKHSNFLPFPIMVEGERVNTTPALWREPKFSVTPQQYEDFYKYLTFDAAAPLETIHVSVDAPVQFTALLFVPPRGQELFGMGRDRWGLDLYVRRVLIQRENKDLLPEYLGFVKGVVDTEDLPLNISRETLQENVVIRKIGQTVTRQVLGHLEKLAAAGADRYAEFWRSHGKVFKLGHTDWTNREKFAGLLRCNTSHHDDARGLSSLDDYIGRAREGQKDIWYISAPNREAARLNPHLEIFRKKGLEVLFLYEPIDEFVMDALGSYKDFALKAVEHADAATLDAFPTVEERKEAEPLAESDAAAFDALLARMKELLGDKVTEVRVSHRLSDSPACLVSPDGTVTSSMEKLLKVMQRDESIPKKVLEVNRDHPILRNLLRIHKADPADPMVENATLQLFEASLLLEGYLADPHALVGRLYGLLEQAGGWYAEVRKL